MKMRIVFLICFNLAAVIAGSAQGRTITNADLEKYARERVKAESDLRENYAKLGFSSPEERERRDIADAKEREDLSVRLQHERVERERVEAEREAALRAAAAYYTYLRSQQTEPQIDAQGYYWSYGRRYRLPQNRQYQQPGYYAGGQFWPTGSATPPRPLIAPGRSRPRH